MTVGVIHLINGQPPNRGNTCISGYDAGKPNYALSNFAPPDAPNNPHRTPGGKPAYAFNDPDVGTVNFPTSEHYLHFQQLSAPAKQQMLDKGWADARTIDILRGKTDPNSQWHIGPNELHASIKNAQGTYDDGKWIEKSKDAQMQINATKYQQSPGFKASIDEAIKLGTTLDGGGAASIIEDTASIGGGKPENKWGTGPRGEGLNMLGNSQTAFANMIKNDPNLQRNLSQPNAAPPTINHFATPGARAQYDHAQAQYQSGIQVALKAARAGFPNAVNQPDTSDLGPTVVRNFASAAQVALGAASNMQTASAGVGSANTQPQVSPTHPASAPRRQSAAEYILSKTGNQYGIKDLKVKADANIQGQSVVQLSFNSPQHAQAFVAEMKSKNIHLLARGDNVFLAQDKQQNVFNALGVGSYGRNNPQPIAAVLLQQQMSAQQQRAAPQPATPLPSQPAQKSQPQQPSGKRQTGTDIDLATLGPQQPAPNAGNQSVSRPNPFSRFTNPSKATTKSDDAIHKLGGKLADRYMKACSKAKSGEQLDKLLKAAFNDVIKLQEKNPGKAAGILSGYLDIINGKIGDKRDEIANANVTARRRP